jgi:beta-aspartyl-peptidase (threonine type)
LITDRARARLAEKGTVGAVARDREGRFAAATSTGGIVGKRRGRVGDSPIPGAGTWADDRVALSATGDGEAILRVALTRSIALGALRGGDLRGGDLRAAIVDALRELARITGGSAGVIGVDRDGVIGVQLSATMPIAWADRPGEVIDSMGYQL